MSEFYPSKRRFRATATPVLLPSRKTPYPMRRYESDTFKYTMCEKPSDILALERKIIDLGYTDRTFETKGFRKLPDLKTARDLFNMISDLYLRIETIEDHIPSQPAFREVVSEEVAFEKNVPVRVAKPMIEAFLKKFLRTHKRVYPSDIADELGIRYETVRKVFGLLQKEGKLRMME